MLENIERFSFNKYYAFLGKAVTGGMEKRRCKRCILVFKVRAKLRLIRVKRKREDLTRHKNASSDHVQRGLHSLLSGKKDAEMQSNALNRTDTGRYFG